jgi:hypothetical protein
MFSQLIRQHRQHERAVAKWNALRESLPGTVDDSSRGLTICSVAYRAKACLALNERLIRQLNPDQPRPEWLIFDNNVDVSDRLDPTDPRFTVIPAPTRDIDMGYEHALGIGALLARVRTRFLLVLDPDCFVVRPDWICDVLRHMETEGLGFFGTPINPRRFNSYRYFPYMVCMFIDLSRVSPRELCFLPGVWQWRTNLTYRARKACAGIPKAGFVFRSLLTEQWRTNGWQIKARFGDGRDVRFECTQAVWDIASEMPRGTIKALVHALTPASVSPLPKQPGYCTPRGFAALGAPDVGAYGWEEFMWRDQPFAFHVGSVHSTAVDYFPALTAAVQTFAGRSPTPTLIGG